ncbi:MAG: O-antigen translocase [Terriglobales bacterium]
MASTSYPNELAVLSSPAVSEPVETQAAEKHSYGQILKSSVLVGGSSFLNIGIGIIRTKALAVLLGPGGFGLFGLFGSVADLTQNIAELGVNSSGVRQIAEAVGTGDRITIARTAAILRRTSIVLGAFGAAFLILFSKQVSKITFGGTEEALPISLLSLVVLFKIVSAGQASLIQGTRRIADLAKMSVLGALFGVFTAIPLIYFFREKGVVPSLVSVAGMTILTSWWYSRKIAVEKVTVTFAEVRKEASALLKLGSVFMASGFMTMGVAYFVRIAVLRMVGYEATGLYQSAWNLGGFYVGIILQAMGADFYPRLTASINNYEEANRLVNEQTLIGLLIAGPGVLATLTFAPLVIAMFYSAKFAAAVGVLRWICLGATLQVVTWPMGFIAVAKGRQGFFFVSEFAWTVFAIIAALFCIKHWGVEGAGVAFFCSYVLHALITYPIARHLSGFHWSASNVAMGSMFLCVIGLAFCSWYFLPFRWATIAGIAATVWLSIYSFRAIIHLVPSESLPRPVKRLLRHCNLRAYA